MEEKGKIKLWIVDDHEIFRQGLMMLFKPSKRIKIDQSFENGYKFIQFINESNMPDVILMDIKMPVMDGIDATTRAVEKFPDVKIIALTMFGEEEYLESMLNAGIKGFLLKNTGVDELERAIEIVNSGKSYFSPDVLQTLTELLRDNKDKKTNDKPDIEITDRELEVLQLICEGYTNTEIADKLFISQRTVDGHRANLISKTGVKNTAALVSYAIKYGYYKV